MLLDGRKSGLPMASTFSRKLRQETSKGEGQPERGQGEGEGAQGGGGGSGSGSGSSGGGDGGSGGGGGGGAAAKAGERRRACVGAERGARTRKRCRPGLASAPCRRSAPGSQPTRTRP
eukprot:scaffold107419_cov65-Phaeocystis_antarctica.AAC.2